MGILRIVGLLRRSIKPPARVGLIRNVSSHPVCRELRSCIGGQIVHWTDGHEQLKTLGAVSGIETNGTTEISVICQWTAIWLGHKYAPTTKNLPISVFPNGAQVQHHDGITHLVCECPNGAPKQIYVLIPPGHPKTISL